MSIHSYVGILENNKIKYIYVHDGEKLYHVLNDNFNSFEQAKNLVMLGHMNAIHLEINRESIQEHGKKENKDDLNKNIYKTWGVPFEAININEIKKNNRYLAMYFWIFDKEWIRYKIFSQPTSFSRKKHYEKHKSH